MEVRSINVNSRVCLFSVLCAKNLAKKDFFSKYHLALHLYNVICVFLKINFYVRVYVYVSVCVCSHSMHVEVGRQLAGVSSLLPQCWYQALDLELVGPDI